MSEQLTRRQLRELERAGGVTPQAEESRAATISVATPAVATPPAPDTQASNQPDISQLTRRQIRELGLHSDSITAPAQSEVSPPLAQKTQSSYVEAGETASRRLIRESLKEVDEAEIAALPKKPSEIQSLEAPDELVFTGTNLLAEPSTQSIVLASTSEAIELPLDTGEIVTTGSISIVSDPATGSQTAGFDIDGLSSSAESVTGVVSTVSPISAKYLVDQRATMGVVPQSVLRKGWWKPWALAIGSLGLVVTAILAAVTILGAVGG